MVKVNNMERNEFDRIIANPYAASSSNFNPHKMNQLD